MKLRLVLLLTILLACTDAYAGGKTQRGLPRTEHGLMNNLVGCLRYRDTATYFNLFVPFDTLWQLALHNQDRSPEALKELEHLREHPQALIQFDPRFNLDIMGRFNAILKKGEDSGLHWEGIQMLRYELHKQPLTSSNMIGYDRIAPERFKGYLFVKDVLGRTVWCVSIQEIQKVNGFFFGGQVVNMLEASSVDEYLAKEIAEAAYLRWLDAHPLADSAMIDSMRGGKRLAVPRDSTDMDDISRNRRLILERKYYEGLFDNEIPVKLYVRYMKDAQGTNKPMLFDGLYKFGDQKSYVKLDVMRDPATGKWTMEDQIPMGSMDLYLKDRMYTGTWVNGDDNGYEVKLKETGVPPRKVEAMDNVLDKGLSGRLDEASFYTDTVSGKLLAKMDAEKKEDEKLTKEEREEQEKLRKEQEAELKADSEEEEKFQKAIRKAEKLERKNARKQQRRNMRRMDD